MSLHLVARLEGEELALRTARQMEWIGGDKVCLIGNVNCVALDTGTDEEVIESAGYALRHGMPGGGYIFSTSNCIYPGMRLDRYELMLEVWRREGNYQA
jgi:uroporphyrinogen decarboxylase